MQFNRIRYYVFFHDISLLFLSQFTRLSHFKKSCKAWSLLISGILPESSQSAILAFISLVTSSVLFSDSIRKCCDVFDTLILCLYYFYNTLILFYACPILDLDRRPLTCITASYRLCCRHRQRFTTSLTWGISPR